MERLKQPGVSCWDFSGIYKVLECPGLSDTVIHNDLRGLSGTNCYCDEEAHRYISGMIEEKDQGLIHFIDSGNYHYLTYIFLEELQKSMHHESIFHESMHHESIHHESMHHESMHHESILLVVFDNHTDMQPPSFGNLLSCGGWIDYALGNFPILKQVWLIGPDEEALSRIEPEKCKKLRCLSRETLAGWRGSDRFKEKVKGWFSEGFALSGSALSGSALSGSALSGSALSGSALSGFALSGSVLPAEQMYLSIDKDILSPEFASTSWSQGDTTLSELSYMVKILLDSSGKNGIALAGVDICGESEPEDYEGARLGAKSNRTLLDLLLQNLSDEKTAAGE